MLTSGLNTLILFQSVGESGAVASLSSLVSVDVDVEELASAGSELTPIVVTVIRRLPLGGRADDGGELAPLGLLGGELLARKTFFHSSSMEVLEAGVDAAVVALVDEPLAKGRRVGVDCNLAPACCCCC